MSESTGLSVPLLQTLHESLTVGECHYDQVSWQGRQQSAWRVRDYDVITIAAGGGFTLEWARRRVQVPAGSAAIIPGGIRRRARRSDAGGAVAICWFNLHCRVMHGALTPFALFDTPTVLSGAVVQELLEVHRRVSQDSTGATTLAGALAARRLALEVLDLVLPELPQRPDRRATGHDLTELLQWLDSSLSGDVSVEDMADFCDLSVSRFHRVFRDGTGETPHRYLRRKRLERAADLIRTTDMSIGDVARELGFADQFHLSRVFKGEYGMPPSRFRRSSQVDFL